MDHLGVAPLVRYIVSIRLIHSNLRQQLVIWPIFDKKRRECCIHGSSASLSISISSISFLDLSCNPHLDLPLCCSPIFLMLRERDLRDCCCPDENEDGSWTHFSYFRPLPSKFDLHEVVC